MISSSQNYSDFFEQVTGWPPYPCQIAFMHAESSHVLLKFPTGIGKTLTVLVSWLYRQKIGKAPTRLVIVEPMRVLVTQVVEEAKRVIEASGLPISVHLLMGGQVDNTWISQPEMPCVVVGTQDQLLSRQMNRGYSCSRWSWPQHFGLLNNDCEFFIDECQLMGPGYATSVELSYWRHKLGSEGDCRVIWSSATLDVKPLSERDIQATEINLSEQDFFNKVLIKKINRSKELIRISVGLGNYGNELAELVIKHHQIGTMTLIILNQVSRAIEVFDALVKSGVPIRLLHGRFRRIEREGLVHELKEFKGIIVSTQVVEAGVDLDARTLFSEVASWASMVQRIGRCGRNDTYSLAQIYWINCEGWPESDLLPYSLEECQWSQQTLENPSLTDVSIKNLLQIQAPSQELRGKTIDSDLLDTLFDNHPDPDGRDIDISCFIRDQTVPSIEVAWVNEPPSPDWSPCDFELCPIPHNLLLKFSVKAYIWNDFTECWRLGEPKVGKVAVLLRQQGGYSERLGFTGDPKDIPPELPTTSQESQKAGWDRPSYLPATQAQHGAGQADEMERILQVLNYLELPSWLIEVAAYSDLGKSHSVWQFTATGEEKPSTLMAKSNTMGRHSRKGFRHELASAVALMMLDKPFIYSFLAAAHHGKCRYRWTAWEWEDEGFIKGIKTGDVLPPTDLGIFHTPKLTLKLPDRISWEREVWKVYKAIGPFRLAFLETLIRATDIADSKKYERDPKGIKAE